MTTATATSTILANISTAYEAAKGAWTGRSWDDGDKITPDTTNDQIAGMLRRGDDIAVTCWGIEESDDSFRRRVRRAVDEVQLQEGNEDEFAAACDTLRELAEESDAGVAEQAQLAEKSARLAMDAVKAGERQDAYVYAWEAARIERQYGDAPTWGPFADAVKVWSESDDEDPVAAARTAYIALFADLAAAVAFEDSCLSAGDEFLPEHARAVREDNSTATPEYYAWLSEQAEQAGAVYNAAE